jgi:hypothetical protein
LEEINMTNITFEINGTTYTTSNGTHFYAEANGTKSRIKKAEFDEAYTQYIENTSREAEEAIAVEEALEAVQEAPAQEKPKKANRKRTPKNVGHRKTYGDIEVILTDKQVDFIRHLPDTCFWEYGIESSIWVDALCDEIGGQFAGKPMTVGAMISTICEKGLGKRGKDRINGRKCTSFALSELGKMVAKDLGL